MKIVIISKNENAESIAYNLKLYKDFDIYLVAPNAAKSKYNAINLTKLNDSDLLDYETLKANLNIERFGWYFQQFLKYECILKLKGDEFMIIDGDSVVSPELCVNNVFFSVRGRPVNPEYNRFYKKIFPVDKIVTEYLITNQMVFKKDILLELINDIEKRFELDWRLVISNVINEDNVGNCVWFSEYQTYANYALNRYKSLKIRPTKVFRRFDLINDSIDNGIVKYNIISFENYHKSGLLRTVRAKVYYWLGIELG
jgi:hypothetical protein